MIIFVGWEGDVYAIIIKSIGITHKLGTQIGAFRCLDGLVPGRVCNTDQLSN